MAGILARTMIDYEATGLNDSDTWMGPFLACPENETVDIFEVNFLSPVVSAALTAKGKNEYAMLSGRFSIGFMVPADGWQNR
jgi:hypothetical protein